MVTNLLLALILSFFLSSAVFLWLFYRHISKTLQQFITPEAEGKASPLANITDVAAGMFARAVIAQGKGLLMGLQSGAVRAEKAIASDIAEGAMQQTPVGALLTSFPALRKSLRRNPGLMDVALQFLANRQSRSPGNGSTESQPKFNL